MDDGFGAFILLGRDAAEAHGVRWNLPVGPDGVAERADALDLMDLCGVANGTGNLVRDLGSDRAVLKVINRQRISAGQSVLEKRELSPKWQDLLKAAALHAALIRQRTPQHVAYQVVRPLRALGTCVQAGSGNEPDKLDTEDIRVTLDVATKAQPCGKLAGLIRGLLSSLLDARLICQNGPFGYIFPPPPLKAAKRPAPILPTLDARAGAEKLPPPHVLEELTDIVLLRRPETFLDAMRMAALTVNLATGLRLGEYTKLPVDWRVCRMHLQIGETSTAPTPPAPARTIWLRHFREKHGGIGGAEGAALVPAYQQVASQFEAMLEECLDRAAKLTAPLRERLRRQAETGRIFPEFEPGDLVTLVEIYPRLTGNPIVRHPEPPAEWVDAYRASFDAARLHDIAGQQNAAGGPFLYPFYTYWHRWKQKNGTPPFRSADGTILGRRTRHRYDRMFLKIADLEDYLPTAMPTKQSDTQPYRVLGGAGPSRLMQAHDMLFLMPKRSLIDGRNQGICDVTRYIAVGVLGNADIQAVLREDRSSFFARYGLADIAGTYSLRTHAIRHRHHTELAEQGVSNAILAKRFNRRPPENHHYDHRTLGQRLGGLELPEGRTGLPPAAVRIARAIQSGGGGGRGG
jgi:hypothetical protein